MRFYVMLFVLLISGELYSQNVLGVQSKNFNTNPMSWGFIKETPAEAKEVRGDTYLHTQWYKGTINFINDGVVADKDIRYNLKSNSFEIKMDGVEKVSEIKYVKSFEIFNELTRQNEKYVNASGVNETGVKLIGALRELHVGSYTLYSRTEIKLVQGKYVSALDMGDNDDYYSKKVVYYVLKGKNLIEVNLNKKHFAKAFPEHEKEILEHIKKNNLSLKKENDLIAAISYLNSLNV